MASALYDKGRNKFAEGLVNWQTGGDTIRTCLVKTAYAVNLTAHEWFSDLAAANVVGNGGANDRANCPQITLATPTAGVCTGANVTVTAVPANAGNCSYIVVFKDSGADGNSALLAYIDTATGLPVTPNGGDIAINWDQGSNGIFKL